MKVETKERSRKKRRVWPWILLVVLAALLAGAAFFFRTYVIFEGQLYRRDLPVMDLRGQEPDEERLSQVRSVFPQAEVLYDIRVGENTYDATSEKLVTGEFSTEDLPSFERFPALWEVDASACGDISAILALRHALPEVEVTWNAQVGGKSWDGDTRELTLPDLSAQEIRAAVERLPYLESVTLTDSTLTPAEQSALTEEYPAIRFAWDVLLAGQRFTREDTVLDFSGRALTEGEMAEIREYVPLLPAAGELRMLGCGQSDEALMALSDALPGVRVVWDTSLFGVPFTTEDEELCFDEISMTIEDAAQIEAFLPYMPRLTKVTMLLCGISNEDMEALNLRHENVQFVWMVNVYGYGVRTDQTYFTVYNCPLLFRSNGVAEELYYCHQMEAIDIGHMRDFGNTFFFTGMPHLKYLIISSTSHQSIPELASLRELVWVEAFWCSLRDITSLTGITSIEHLNIVYKPVKSEETARQDMEVLKSLTGLKRLWIGANMYSERQVAELREALPNTQIVLIYDLAVTAKGWRTDEEYYKMRNALHMYYMTDEGDTQLVNPFTGERSQYEWTNPFR